MKRRRQAAPPAARGGRQGANGDPAARGGMLRMLWREYGIFVWVIGAVLLIRTFIIEPYLIPSGSMRPSLLVGDHLFVNKFVYGIKIPGTEWRLPGFRAPRRGDIVVFSVARDRLGEVHPADRKPELPRENFVKRIVGLPGDEIDYRDGQLYVGGELVSAEHRGEVVPGGVGGSLQVLWEDLFGYEHAILRDLSSPRQMRRKLVVPPNRYFVMGDNRDHSLDSRKWGTVREIDIKGPALVIYWSWDWHGSWGELLNPLTWVRLLSDKTRWHRIGDRIE